MSSIKEVKHNCGATLMLGIPTLGRPVPLQWALNFKSLSPPINFNQEFNLVYGKEIGFARNALAKAALERNCKYLFFLGDDTVVPPHTLRQLIYRMENHPGVDVVGGVYCSKSDPPAPLVFRGNGVGSYWDWKIGEFFRCTGLGMDCTLIRVEILKKLPEPWFETISTDKFLDGILSVEEWTEDLRFCKKVEEAGFGIWCDASVICEHWDVYGNKVYTLPKDSLPMRQRGVTKDKKCLMLGPRIPLTDESYDVTLCSQDSDLDVDYRLQFDNLPFESSEFDFVCVTEPVLDIERYLSEWRRVAKCGAKIAINLNKRLDSEVVCFSLCAEMNGSFVEFINSDLKEKLLVVGA